MDVLNEDELGGLQPLSGGTYSPLYKNLVVLQVGHAIILYYAEWTVKYSPYITIRKVEKTYGRKYQYGHHPQKQGWLIKRVR